MSPTPAFRRVADHNHRHGDAVASSGRDRAKPRMGSIAFRGQAAFARWEFAEPANQHRRTALQYERHECRRTGATA
jgi:hypothetical protein